jgi:DNA-binding MarR family transcriptional regulator
VTRKRSIPGESGRYAYEGLDRALHEKARLSMMVSLSTRPEGLLFGELKELCALTDGNLSRHLDVLRDEGLVDVWKGYSGRRPQTLVRLTAKGRERFLRYLGELQQLLEDTRGALEAAGTAAKKPLRPDLDFSFHPA